MKTFKTNFLILLCVLFAFNFASTQEEQPTMYVVHTDNVNFNMIPKYEQLSKQLKESCEKYNIQDVNWTAISVEDGRYVYVSPIKSMAELDNDPMASLAEKMGKEAMGKMFNEMDECYDSHGNAVVHHMPDLSFNPEGYSIEGKNEREYHFLYYSPKNAKKMKEAMANVKALFETKGIKNGYQVFHSGFGSEESYYMVSVSGMDDLEMAKVGKENDEIFGKEGDATFFEVIKLATKYDQLEAKVRPDLSYNPKN